MGNYRLTEAAKADLRRIYRFGFERFGEVEADNYYAGPFDRFDSIAENPNQYPAVDHIRQGYRRCVYRSDSVYFRVTDEGVEIMRVIGMQEL